MQQRPKAMLLREPVFWALSSTRPDYRNDSVMCITGTGMSDLRQCYDFHNNLRFLWSLHCKIISNKYWNLYVNSKKKKIQLTASSFNSFNKSMTAAKTCRFLWLTNVARLVIRHVNVKREAAKLRVCLRVLLWACRLPQPPDFQWIIVEYTPDRPSARQWINPDFLCCVVACLVVQRGFKKPHCEQGLYSTITLGYSVISLGLCSNF